MLIGGFILDPEQGRLQIPIVQSPTKEDVENTIRRYACYDGIIALSIVPEPDCGPRELKVYIGSGNFFLILSHNLECGDIDVKTISNERAGAEMVDILGDRYPARSMTKDLNFICSCFKEFLGVGDVSESSLIIS
ncbi:hypothetical protein [Pseudomonas sp. AMR01]|uniref:DUF6911 family protein n=1 Tax=Pseudomonas sp. AMR01 TaxID=3064904 RepID=UPI0035C259E7